MAQKQIRLSPSSIANWMSVIFANSIGKGTFWEYLDMVVENPAVSRNAFQRVYDMILSYGHEPFVQFKQDLMKYHFFSDPVGHGGGCDFWA